MADEPGERNTTGVPQRTRGPAFTLTRHISRVAAIFDAAPVAVGVWSVDGELLHANPVLCDLVGQHSRHQVRQLFGCVLRRDRSVALGAEKVGGEEL